MIYVFSFLIRFWNHPCNFKELVLQDYLMDFDVFWCKIKKRFCLFRFFSLLITFVELKTTKTSRVVKKSVLTRYFLQTRCHLFRFWKITLPVMMGSSISKYGTLFLGIAWKLLSYLSSWWPPIFSPNGAFYRLILQGKKIHTMNQEWDCLPPTSACPCSSSRPR